MRDPKWRSPAIGDTGSGYDIGRRGLAVAMAALDGRGSATGQVDAARTPFGQLESLTAAIYAAGNPTALIAAFAPGVLSLAAADRVQLNGENRRWSWTGSVIREGALNMGRDVLSSCTWVGFRC